MSFSSQEDAASRAEAFLRTGDTASAEVIYRQILEATPAGERGRRGGGAAGCALPQPGDGPADQERQPKARNSA